MTTEEQIFSEEYIEDIEDELEGAEEDLEAETEPGTTAEYETEAGEPEDHDEVSSDEPIAGEVDSEPPEYGVEGAPSTVETDLGIEPMEGYDESILEMSREEAQVDETRLLDAWYAEFADPMTIALAQQQPSLSQTTAEVVLGRDDRIQVNNTTAYPWRTICSLILTAKDGSKWIGTGWLVGPRTVITAGHCVYLHGHGGWVRSIEVIPGRNGSRRPYGSCIATSFRSVKGWTHKKKRSYDYGAIILPRNCAYGNRLGYFGYANLRSSSLRGLNVNLSGYPGDKPRGTQWWHARRIRWVTSRRLIYNIDTAGGQSGAPVWRLRNGKRHVVAIHTNGSTSGNSATRIVKAVFNNIKNWKNL